MEEYKENEILTIKKCQHIEFPNLATRRNRPCQTLLAEKVPVMNNFKLKSKLIFPFSGIHQQLLKLYNWPNFEDSLKH